EVSLLIRRLMDRLCIDSSKIKCILTSASVPSEKDDAIQKFAQGLTGTKSEKEFAVVRECLEEICGGKQGNLQGAECFGSLSLNNLQADVNMQLKEIAKIADRYAVDDPNADDVAISNWLYEVLSKQPII